jgi:TfoX/Sxy family transcriptional regulator of competence genes
MAYDTILAARIRAYLSDVPAIEMEEKKMFRGLAFLVNGKMCVNVSGENLMCRFEPAMQEQLEKKAGYEPMIMKGKKIAGYCYVAPDGLKGRKDLDFWLKLCLSFNDQAKASKKAKKKK